MPKLWSETIEAHRRAVREITLDTTVALVARQGLASVTMSQIAEEAGIGRATLYRYFSDVDSILIAWHERLIAHHLQHLARVRDQISDPYQRLKAVLEAYATLAHQHHGSELSAALHQREHVAHAREQLVEFLRELVEDACRAGTLRSDVPAGELVGYCLHALAAAGDLSSKAAVRRLLSVTMAGLQPVA